MSNPLRVVGIYNNYTFIKCLKIYYDRNIVKSNKSSILYKHFKKEHGTEALRKVCSKWNQSIIMNSFICNRSRQNKYFQIYLNYFSHFIATPWQLLSKIIWLKWNLNEEGKTHIKLNLPSNGSDIFPWDDSETQIAVNLAMKMCEFDSKHVQEMLYKKIRILSS